MAELDINEQLRLISLGLLKNKNDMVAVHELITQTLNDIVQLNTIIVSYKKEIKELRGRIELLEGK